MNKYEGMCNKLENLKQIPRRNRTDEEEGEIRRLQISITAWRAHPPITVDSPEWRKMRLDIMKRRTAEIKV